MKGHSSEEPARLQPWPPPIHMQGTASHRRGLCGSCLALRDLGRGSCIALVLSLLPAPSCLLLLLEESGGQMSRMLKGPALPQHESNSHTDKRHWERPSVPQPLCGKTPASHGAAALTAAGPQGNESMQHMLARRDPTVEQTVPRELGKGQPHVKDLCPLGKAQLLLP